MALQDLTPQLRTRLSRLERLVGWFVTLATLLLLAGLIYYVYQIAQRKGWFLKKMPYYTFVRNATGLKQGDPVKMMGFNVGEIVEVQPQPPEDTTYNVFVQFRIKEPYYGYLWEDSRAKITASDFLGNRFIEVTKGTNGPATYRFLELKQVTLAEARDLVGKPGFAFSEEIDAPHGTNLLAKPLDPLTAAGLQAVANAGTNTFYVFDLNAPTKKPAAIWDDKTGRYQPFTHGDKGYWLHVIESPALTERLEQVVSTVEAALPSFLGLTNRLTRVLTNADSLVTHADELLVSAKPILTNFAQISANLTGPKGTLGDWLLPTNLSAQLQTTLGTANATMTTAQTNVALISSNLLISLNNIASLTSNLHAQVEANGLILTEVSDLIIHTDEMVQGLKRHWLLKSSFGPPTNAPPQGVVKPRVGGER